MKIFVNYISVTTATRLGNNGPCSKLSRNSVIQVRHTASKQTNVDWIKYNNYTVCTHWGSSFITVKGLLWFGWLNRERGKEKRLLISQDLKEPRDFCYFSSNKFFQKHKRRCMGSSCWKCGTYLWFQNVFFGNSGLHEVT